MSENKRMAVIVLVFLLLSGIVWRVLYKPAIEDAKSGSVEVSASGGEVRANPVVGDDAAVESGLSASVDEEMPVVREDALSTQDSSGAVGSVSTEELLEDREDFSSSENSSSPLQKHGLAEYQKTEVLSVW